MYQVNLNHQAKEQIKDLVDYYAEYNHQFADKIIYELNVHVERLKIWPESGTYLDQSIKDIRLFSLNSISVYLVYKIYHDKELVELQAVLRQEQMIVLSDFI
jgi:plasmid stabilization system protein ParE